MNIKKLIGLAAFACAFGAHADTLYVDINHPEAGDDPAEGRGTEELPYASIQAAVNAAKEDWTILVRPGVYTNGVTTTVDGYGASRVVIDKRLTVKSTGGKDQTVIEGKFRSAGGQTWGSGAARVILVTADGAESIVQGFTLRNAATQDAGDGRGCGAGFMALANAYVADCTVTNCYGRDTGGALYGGTAIRCLFASNGHGDYHWTGGIVHRANLWYCIVDHYTKNGYGCYSACTNVNCSYFSGGALNYDRSSVYYNCLYNLGTGGGTTTYANCLKTTDAKAFFSPNDYDYETVDDGTDYKKGLTANIYGIFNVPESLRGTDFAGRTIDVSGEACTVGAFDTPVSPQYGAIKMEHKIVGGRIDTMPPVYYLRTRTWPRTITFVRENAAACSHGTLVGVPLMDGKTYCYSVPFSPSTQFGSWAGGNIIRYVDQKIGSDDTGDGTAAKPYATIQKACDSIANPASYPLIKVAPGSYAPFSITLNSGYFGRVFASNGYETASIVGGENTRCATLNGGCTAFILQGFTLTGVNNTTASCNNALTAGYVTLADCMVSNNVAAKSLMNSGCIIRSRFVGNTVGNTLYEGSGIIGFSLFTGNDCGGSVIAGAGNPSVYNCSFYGNTTGGPLVGLANVFVNNCLFDANGCTYSRHADTGIAPNYLYNYVEGSGSAANAKIIDRNPMFVDPEAGDFRVPSTWSAATAGLFGSADAHMDKFGDVAQGDLNGAFPTPAADGHMALGCIQAGLVPAVIVTDDASGLALTGAKVGVNSFSPASPLTVTVAAAADPIRPAYGFVVTEADGQTVTTNLFADTPEWSRTATTEADAFTIEALYSIDFYVDAENGDDGNDGWTAATAKKTLAGLFGTIPLAAGDVVHAAPGTYDEGTQADEADTKGTLTRVIIPAGVTLVSTGGKSVTTIQGEGTTSAGAVRCVVLGKDAWLEGFTLKNGRAISGDGGAAVCSRATGGGTVVDCSITACESGYGSYLTFIRCRFDGCKGQFAYCKLVSCVINRSGDYNPCSDCTVYNSVIMPNYGYYCVQGVSKVYNSLVYGPMGHPSGCEYVNCVCVTNVGEFGMWGSWLRPTDAEAAKVRFVHLNEIGGVTTRPTTAKAKGILVDAGDTAAVCPFDEDTKWDLEGLPRAMNYNVDIGAYEEAGTLLTDMKAILGMRIGSLDWISANAVTNAASQILLDGDDATLEMTKANDSPLATYVTFADGGTLKALVNGKVSATTAKNGLFQMGEYKDGDKVALVYEGEGSVTFGRLISGKGLFIIFR